jgi:hypothetical protein
VLKISLEPVSLEEQLDRVIDLIHTIPHLALEARGYIYLTEDANTLILKAPSVLPESQHLVCERISFDHCLCGKAAASCELVFTDCVDGRHEVRYQDNFPHGHYCVLIVSGGKAWRCKPFCSVSYKHTSGKRPFLPRSRYPAGVIERGWANGKEASAAELTEAESSQPGRIT